jgi:hypothetical protein
MQATDAGVAMAILSISEAARTWHMGRTTIQRAIREGKLSPAVQPNSSKGIDTSEMVRVFGEPCIDAGNDPVRDAGINPGGADPMHVDTGGASQPDTAQTVAVLQAQIDLLKAQLNDAHDRELWFRRQLEDFQRLLPAPAANPPSPKPAPVGKVRVWILLAVLVAALVFAGWRYREMIIFPWPS